MSNPTEQPINPNKMAIRCELCKEEIVGYDEWEMHLMSNRHLSRIKE